MKKACISFAGVLIIFLMMVCLPKENGADTEYLRIHIRANSNSDADQSVKYEIKDLVVAYLAPKVKNISSKSQAIALLEDEKTSVNGLIDGFLEKKGFDYKANAVVRNELFPTRAYEGVTLETGYYDALIIELGKAEGDNWWCVVYPPLCFTDEKVTYKSFILEFIEKFKKG